MRANGQNSHLRDQRTNVDVPKVERYDMTTCVGSEEPRRSAALNDIPRSTNFEFGWWRRQARSRENSMTSRSDVVSRDQKVDLLAILVSV
jgi:hypothetical protein